MGGVCNGAGWLVCCLRNASHPALCTDWLYCLQVRYTDDRRSVHVTTKATAPGGVRTGTPSTLNLKLVWQCKGQHFWG